MLCTIVSIFYLCWRSLWNSSVSYFISFYVLHLSNNALSDHQDLCGSGIELVLGVETQLAFMKLAVYRVCRRAYPKPMLTNMMSISKPRILWEQITGKPNLIWRTREGLLMEMTTKQDLREWVGALRGSRRGSRRERKVWMSIEIPVCQDHFRDHCRERVQGEPEVSFGSGTASYGTPECFPYPSMSLSSSSPFSPLCSRHGTLFWSQPPGF